jgi:hypothetical protein
MGISIFTLKAVLYHALPDFRPMGILLLTVPFGITIYLGVLTVLDGKFISSTFALIKRAAEV